MEIRSFFETVEGIRRCYNIVENRETRYYVACESVSQYTGLKYKNGKEIYEGDIVKSILIDDDLLCSGEIVYDEIMSFFGLLNDAGITPLFRLSKIEITGNIHENPDTEKQDAERIERIS